MIEVMSDCALSEAGIASRNGVVPVDFSTFGPRACETIFFGTALRIEPQS